MSPRVSADLLLVGSIPATSTQEAFRAGSASFGDLVFALPDGETGPRAAWVGYERERLVRPNPAVEVVAETTSPTGIPRHMYESPAFRLRPGTSSVHWESWPRVDDAIASYRVFRELRAAGVIPEGLRFQVVPRLIPDEALVGYHLCYGTFPEWPMYEARDMSVLVRMANYAFAVSGRPVDWVHMAGPRYLRSEDEGFFRPLSGLAVGDARVFLGIVLPLDGEPGLRRRQATASKFLADFGVALYCGFRVAPGSTPEQAITEHRDVVRAVRR